MNQLQKAAALQMMMETPGWAILHDYLVKNSTPSLMPIEGLDSLIKQSYRNGICQGHKEVLDFVKITIENAKRKQSLDIADLPFPMNLKPKQINLIPEP